MKALARLGSLAAAAEEARHWEAVSSLASAAAVAVAALAASESALAAAQAAEHALIGRQFGPGGWERASHEAERRVAEAELERTRCREAVAVVREHMMQAQRVADQSSQRRRSLSLLEERVGLRDRTHWVRLREAAHDD